MRFLLSKIPQPDGGPDAWNGAPLPPVYDAIKDEGGSAWFVDGGNAEILGAPHFSLQKLRAVGVHYPDKRLVREDENALLVRCPEGWTLHHENGSNELVLEEELPEAISVARQKLEHAVALECLSDASGAVVLDGDKAPEGCFSLQKSITTLTARGFPLSSVLSAAGPWSTKLGETYAVKLDKRSRHVFLVHGISDDSDKAGILSLLVHYSRDALFPGYPGGLVLADRLARVSNEERESLRVHAKSMLRELRERVSAAEASSDSHDILDSF